MFSIISCVKASDINPNPPKNLKYIYNDTIDYTTTPFIPQRGNKCLEIIFILSEKTHATAIMSWSIFNICSMWFLKLDFYIKVIPICSKIKYIKKAVVLKLTASIIYL